MSLATIEAVRSGKMLGEIKYALMPVRFSAQEVENKYLYRENTQLVKDQSGRCFLINVMDCSEVMNCDMDNNLVFYEETILMDIEEEDENEAMQEANMKINEMNLDMPYIHLYDLEGNSYTFAINLIDFVWTEFVPY